jgi:hypothetical protein
MNDEGVNWQEERTTIIQQFDVWFAERRLQDVAESYTKGMEDVRADEWEREYEDMMDDYTEWCAKQRKREIDNDDDH